MQKIQEMALNELLSENRRLVDKKVFRPKHWTTSDELRLRLIYRELHARKNNYFFHERRITGVRLVWSLLAATGIMLLYTAFQTVGM